MAKIRCRYCAHFIPSEQIKRLGKCKEKNIELHIRSDGTSCTSYLQRLNSISTQA